VEATDMLKSEHRVIERVLNALERGVERLDPPARLRPGFFLDAVDFIKGFADGCHHKKEEDVLFVSLEAHGLPRDGGPVGVMLLEHDEGRRFTRAIQESATRLEAGDETAAGSLAASVRGYVDLLRRHIDKEDNVLFMMAEQVLPRPEQVAVLEGFMHVEREETGPGVHEKYLALADALEREVASSQP